MLQLDMRVAHYMNLDVQGVLHIAFDKQPTVAKVALTFVPCGLDLAIQNGQVTHDANSLAADAG